jgi:hypothetical protein
MVVVLLLWQHSLCSLGVASGMLQSWMQWSWCGLPYTSDHRTTSSYLF